MPPLAAYPGCTDMCAFQVNAAVKRILLGQVCGPSLGKAPNHQVHERRKDWGQAPRHRGHPSKKRWPGHPPGDTPAVLRSGIQLFPAPSSLALVTGPTYSL